MYVCTVLCSIVSIVSPHLYVCMYSTIHKYVRYPFGPHGPFALQANIKATRVGLESSKVNLDRGLSVCIYLRGGRWSLTSLGLRRLLLDQPPTQPNSGHNVWLMCVSHMVVDGAWAFAGYYESTTKRDQRYRYCARHSPAHTAYTYIVVTCIL